MAGEPERWTVGSLIGVPLGASDRPVAERSRVEVPPPRTGATPASGEPEGEGWTISGGDVRVRSGMGQSPFRSDGVEALTYNNPYNYAIERVWFDGKVVFASEQGELDVNPRVVKVAQEYQIVYGVELDERGKLKAEPERVAGQYNIYDSIPGMAKYSPIWQFNYVVVPRDYQANTLRSERDCLASGYEVVRSNVFEN